MHRIVLVVRHLAALISMREEAVILRQGWQLLVCNSHSSKVLLLSPRSLSLTKADFLRIVSASHGLRRT